MTKSMFKSSFDHLNSFQTYFLLAIQKALFGVCFLNWANNPFTFWFELPLIYMFSYNTSIQLKVLPKFKLYSGDTDNPMSFGCMTPSGGCSIEEIPTQ